LVFVDDMLKKNLTWFCDAIKAYFSKKNNGFFRRNPFAKKQGMNLVF